MREELVLDGVSRNEMQVIKWATEGTKEKLGLSIA